MAELGAPVHLSTQYNIAPTDTVPVIIDFRNERRVHSMRWWLTPSWAPEVSTKFNMFNAKSETLETSRAFHTPFLRQRGILPASSFIEWQQSGGVKIPWCVRPVQNAFAFAVLWDRWERHGNYLESCTVITTRAPEQFEHYHNRFPVILTPSECFEWLSPRTGIATLKAMFHPEIKLPLELFPLSTEINNPKNKDDRAVRPVGESVTLKKQNSLL